MFSSPSLPAGEPSTRNWYQELLDHPDCLGDAVSHRPAENSWLPGVSSVLIVSLHVVCDFADFLRLSACPWQYTLMGDVCVRSVLALNMFSSICSCSTLYLRYFTEANTAMNALTRSIVNGCSG